MDTQRTLLTLRNGLERYETLLLPSRNLAERTRKEYVTDLKDLVVFLKDKCGVSEALRVDSRHLELISPNSTVEATEDPPAEGKWRRSDPTSPSSKSSK